MCPKLRVIIIHYQTTVLALACKVPTVWVYVKAYFEIHRQNSGQ